MPTEKILVVEDEENIQELIRYNLSKEGYQVSCALSGEKGLEAARTENPDLVLLDLMLPGLDGLDVCKELKRDPATQGIAVIMVTAKGDETDIVTGLELGADDYVVKPFSPRELIARVRAVLRRSQQSPSKPDQNQAFMNDKAKRRIFYLGTVMELSRYEYNLLTILIQRPGHVYSREQLMELAWDEPEASMDRTVDAHIKNIRAKLKTINPEIDPIITHRGIGYALTEDL